MAAIDPGLSSPGVESRDLVLVTGPWLAGTSSLIAGLRDQMPDHTFVEADDLGPTDAPVAVVFVVSALALLTESDCALIDLAVDYTDLSWGWCRRSTRTAIGATCWPPTGCCWRAHTALSARAVGGDGGRAGSG